MKKRIISLLLVLATILSLCASAAASNYTTSYTSYTAPSSSDYAYWNGKKVVRASGTTTSEVKWMQAALNYCIKNKGVNAPLLDVDGSFGPASKKACLAFQKKYGLSQDGSFGPSTIAKMKSVLPSTSAAFKKVNYLQWDPRWGSASYGGGNLTDTGCGILSLVNAVYNLTGKLIPPKDLAQWAYNSQYFNKGGAVGIPQRSAYFSAVAKKYGDAYGFQYVGSGTSITDKKLIDHLKNGGTCVVNVPNHFMAIVDYNASTGKYLVFDSAPGVKGGSTRRQGLTTTGGDWKTAQQLSSGNLRVFDYYLYAKK